MIDQLTDDLNQIKAFKAIAKQYESMAGALRVIHTWATFRCGQELVPEHVAKLTVKALRRFLGEVFMQGASIKVCGRCGQAIGPEQDVIYIRRETYEHESLEDCIDALKGLLAECYPNLYYVLGDGGRELEARLRAIPGVVKS